MGYRPFDTDQDRHRGATRGEVGPMVEAARGVIRAVLAKPGSDDECWEGLWRILKGASRLQYDIYVAVMVDELVARRACK